MDDFLTRLLNGLQNASKEPTEDFPFHGDNHGNMLFYKRKTRNNKLIGALQCDMEDAADLPICPPDCPHCKPCFTILYNPTTVH